MTVQIDLEDFYRKRPSVKVVENKTGVLKKCKKIVRCTIPTNKWESSSYKTAYLLKEVEQLKKLGLLAIPIVRHKVINLYLVEGEE